LTSKERGGRFPKGEKKEAGWSRLEGRNWDGGLEKTDVGKPGTEKSGKKKGAAFTDTKERKEDRKEEESSGPEKKAGRRGGKEKDGVQEGPLRLKKRKKGQSPPGKKGKDSRRIKLIGILREEKRETTSTQERDRKKKENFRREGKGKEGKWYSPRGGEAKKRKGLTRRTC